MHKKLQKQIEIRKREIEDLQERINLENELKELDKQERKIVFKKSKLGKFLGAGSKVADIEYKTVKSLSPYAKKAAIAGFGFVFGETKKHKK